MFNAESARTVKRVRSVVTMTEINATIGRKYFTASPLCVNINNLPEYCRAERYDVKKTKHTHKSFRERSTVDDVSVPPVEYDS